MSQTGLLESALRPLDAVRREALLRACRMPWVAGALRRRESRISVLTCASIALAFAATSVAPGLLFVLGPALLGVVHVASDLRYLVVRQNPPRIWFFGVSFGCMALVGVRAAELLDPGALPFSSIEVGLGWGWAIAGALVGAVLDRRAASRIRAALVVPPLLAAAAWAIAHAALARALFAYGHNLVALAIWFILFRPQRARAAWPLALVALGTALLLGGATLGCLREDAPWMARLAEEAKVATGLAAPRSLSLAMSYVFLQSVHYSVWLAWIPQEDLRNDATLTFRMSARAAVSDFGRRGIALIAFAALSVAALSLWSVHRTRAVYLSLATFHGYLELASFAFLWVRSDRREPD